ncbi:MAG TPA: dienelactone hydrolase family protein [Planctomycetaceae bacterium]|nr:dienelactone hydrolase family protein [Planctomycetaceae bacterium]
MRQYICACMMVMVVSNASPSLADPIPGTEPLTWEGDIASRLVDACDAFLLRRLEESIERRESFWNRDLSSPEAYEKSIAGNRQLLAHLLGIRDRRIPFAGLTIAETTARPGKIAESDHATAFAVSWPVIGDIHGEGILLEPKSREVFATVIVLPDADQTPEQLCGLTEGVPAEAQLPRRLVEQGCRVVVPVLISREMSKRNNRANLSNREYLYRPAFELGRHIIGYELQKILALVDWANAKGDAEHQIGVAGYGEGGLLAFYASAIDNRIDATYVSGYFGSRETIWQQPLARNVFNLLTEFGDAQVAAMIAPRALTIALTDHPSVVLPGEGGAPAIIETPNHEQAKAEYEKARSLIKGLGVKLGDNLSLVKPPNWTLETTSKSFFSNESRDAILTMLRIGVGTIDPWVWETNAGGFREAERMQRQIAEIDRFTQDVLNESSVVRKAFLSDIDTTSLETYEKSTEYYRQIFRKDVIGEFALPLKKFNARSRQTWETDKWTGHEVVLDLFDGVFAYGVLLVPKGIEPDEKRPVVVCQHGLEGRPTDVFLNDHQAYHDFAAKLAERGFITFAPQNIYIFQDRFRTLQRKAYPLGKTLFSIMVPQHQQIVNWLKTQPNVDPERIAFYGLSYGGKSAMRIPALVTDYCLSICSADFNEWVLKNASTRHPFSYVWTGEYEIFEWDLGSTFNYAEMAALIAPRPFMVERGHFDGVGWDDWIAYEYAKVRFLYAAKLHIPERTEIEFFDGPHTINGQGTYRFLHKHLNWPEPE